LRCRQAIYLVVLVVLITPWPALAVMTAGEPGCRQWLPVRQSDAGSLYRRCRADSDLPEVMIRTRFQAPPGRVHSVVTDYDRFAEFIPNVRVSRVLDSQADGTRWVYHELNFPAPVADRVYVIRSQERASRPAGGYYRIDWALAERVFPVLQDAAGMQPVAFSGFWELAPADGGRTTDARYSVHSDPGGLVPDWLVMRMTGRYVEQVIAAIRRRLGEPQRPE
jgi:hypothetical protein